MVLAMMFAVSGVTYAQANNPTNNDYTVLAPLPGIGDTAGGKTTFPTYLNAAFNLAIGIAAGLAFAMITYGGIMYATSDAISGKSQGREYIENALWGLLLVIGAYTILYTINPQILNFNLSFARPQIKAGVPTVEAVAPMTKEQIAESNRVRQVLMSNGVLTASNPCTAGQTTGCVNLDGLQQSVIDGLKRLGSIGSFTPMITGGTEGGHSIGSAHNNGNAVDISPNSGITRTVVPTGQTLSQCGIYSSPTGGKFLWEPRGSTCGGTVPSSADHWHVAF